MESKYATADEIKNKFLFLKEYGFELSREETKNYGSYVEFKGNGIKIYLSFDYRDYFLYFLIIRGEETKYPNDNDNENIKSFCDLAKKYNADYNCNTLQPNYDEGYGKALNNNVTLLEKYGSNILKGKEWI
jgi:hypothetical protein